MSKRIVLVDVFGYELFSGDSVAAPSDEATKPAPVASAEKPIDARQGGPLESGIFFRGAPRLRKTG